MTRCWNKKYPKRFRKLPKKTSNNCLYIEVFFKNRPKVHFGYICRIILTQNFQKSFNLVTLIETHTWLVVWAKAPENERVKRGPDQLDNVADARKMRESLKDRKTLLNWRKIESNRNTLKKYWMKPYCIEEIYLKTRIVLKN